MSATVKIVIPEDMYLGMLWGENSVPLGFLTPDGTDSAAQKRKATVDNWVRQNERYRSKNKVHTTTVKNELLSGFKLSKSTRRWTTSNVVWRVIDPRGFEIEISSENLMALINDTSIINGEILGRLIYGRTTGSNVLLHEKSEEFLAAQELTSVVNKNISMKDIKPGYMVSLHNAQVLEYVGFFYKIEEKRFNEQHSDKFVAFSDKKTHVFLDTSNKSIHVFSSPKVGKIVSTENEKTLAESLAQLNLLVNEGRRINSSGYSTILGFSTTNKTLLYSYEEITEEQFFEYHTSKRDSYDSNDAFIIDKNDTVYMTNYYHPDHYDHAKYLHNKTKKYNNHDTWKKLTSNPLEGKFVTAKATQTGGYYRSAYYTDITAHWFDITDGRKSLCWLKINVVDIVPLSYYYR